ncbi:MAG: aldehyde dehydrogenase family protein [Ilumatobacter sp.]|nr:aldehyde dehydrogenase family protein [Ilumatobacter sp.]
MGHLTSLTAGQQIVFGGDRVATVDAELAGAFREGDRLVVVQSDGALLHIAAAEHALVDAAVTAAADGFAGLAGCSDEAISEFFDRFATLLADDGAFEPIAAANRGDVEQARDRGRSTTRLELSATMRADMIAGLHGWRDTSATRDVVVGEIAHPGWRVEARRAPLGIVGFVFEGRPNVFADACGVVRTGNSVVFRIGSDALGTARAIVEHALRPALHAAGLPEGVVQLVDSPAHSAGHALFSDARLALAVARGSGAAVAQLGAVAAQSGVPVSLHGTGGAWVVAGETAAPATLERVVRHSLDRKVCNTLNVCAVPARRAAELIPSVLAGLEAAAEGRSASPRLHVVAGSEEFVPAECFDREVSVERADGAHQERFASTLPEAGLATEWEWEHSPEMTLVVVDDVAHAVRLCNTYSPHFTASLVSDDDAEHDRFYAGVDAPFVGNGFTRWVDGQYALGAPELGLSNWQGGRMLGRGAVLSGDSVHTVRYRAVVADHSTHR